MPTPPFSCARPAQRRRFAQDRLDELRAAIRRDPTLLAERMFGGPPRYKSSREWRWGEHGRLALVLKGPRAGCYFDHSKGEGGDVITRAVELCGGDFARAVRLLAREYGIDVDGKHPTPQAANSDAQPPAADTDAQRLRIARLIWRTAQPLAGTPAAAYLRARHLLLDRLPPSIWHELRFHPACRRGADEQHPALIARMIDPATGAACGIHRTFLKRDGSDRLRDERGKMMLGTFGVVRFGADDAEALAIGEGIESVLSFAQMSGYTNTAFVAGLSTAGVKRFPILPHVKRLIVAADNDTPGLAAARALAARYHAAGIQASIVVPPDGKRDWNDTLAALAARIAA